MMQRTLTWRRTHPRLDTLVLWALVSAGCATTTTPLVRQQCYNADQQLADVWRPLEALREKGCVEAASGVGSSDCDRLRREIERLAVVCPGHVPTLMANAVIAYEDEHRPAKAQQLLDLILAQAMKHADAAILRARIAAEEGNLPFAHRLLEQQLRLAPDHAGLHETYAATLYLERQFADATRELTTAAALGAPGWRVAYHRGLIE